MTTTFPGIKILELKRGRPYRARLGANECLFGVSGAALRALDAAKDQISLYCDPAHVDLRSALALLTGASMDQIVVGEGIDGLLSLFVRSVIKHDTVAVTGLGAYPTFSYSVISFGGKLSFANYTADFYADIDAIAERVRSIRAGMCYLSNPDSPTGSFIDNGRLIDWINSIPDYCLILLDEAYSEFVPVERRLPWSFQRPNLIRLRTFSKAYGLAGARIGYAVCSKEMIEKADRVRLHYGVGKMSEIMAIAALTDSAYFAKVLKLTEQGRAYLEGIAASLSLRSVPSMTNFVSIDIGSSARAEQVARAIEEADIFIRHPAEDRVNRLIRVTVGPHESLRLFADALTAAVPK